MMLSTMHFYGNRDPDTLEYAMGHKRLDRQLRILECIDTKNDGRSGG